MECVEGVCVEVDGVGWMVYREIIIIIQGLLTKCTSQPKAD